jgi:hypothetical protein
MGYFLLAFVSIVGLLLSIACHILGWLDREPPWGTSNFFLHAGIFVVWIPLIVFAQHTKPKGSRGNFEHLLAEMPGWVRKASMGLLLYEVANFGYYIYCTRQYPRNAVPFPVLLRGFSGHWMLFYGWSVAGFVALGRLARKKGPDAFRGA